MKVEDVKSTMDKALLTMALPKNRPPKLLSDNGSCCISNELAEYLEEKKIVKLDNYFSPGQLEVKMEVFVQYYNYKRYHESLQNLTPADVYFGSGQKKLKHRKMIKNKTLNARKIQFQENQLNLREYSLKF